MSDQDELPTPPPEGAKRPDPPPAPPAPFKVQLTRKFSRKVRRAYVKQAQKDMKEIFEKAKEWPWRKRLKLGLMIIRGK